METTKTYLEMTPAERIATLPYKLKNFVKVNVPGSEAQEKNGTGESIWAELTDHDTRRYYSNGTGTAYAIIRNDSFFFQELRYGQRVQIQLRGKKAPIISFARTLKKLTANPMAAPYAEGEAAVVPTHALAQVRSLTDDERVLFLEGRLGYGGDGLFLHPLATEADVIAAVVAPTRPVPTTTD